MTKNIYYDTEFLEGTQKKRFLGIPYGNTRNTIDLISIGMVDDEGNKYYAISKDFNLREAWGRYDVKKKKYNEYHYKNGDAIYFTDSVDPEALEIEHKNKLRKSKFSHSFICGEEYKDYWIRENVLKPVWEQLKNKEYGGTITRGFTYGNMKWLLNEYGKSNKQIAEEIVEFVYGFAVTGYPQGNTNKIIPKDINLFAYYGAYDHVALAWLYGKMIDLPKGFPKYTRDLQQTSDEKKHLVKGRMKDHPDFPENKGHHSAIFDAEWNKELHGFLKQLN